MCEVSDGQPSGMQLYNSQLSSEEHFSRLDFSLDNDTCKDKEVSIELGINRNADAVRFKTSVCQAEGEVVE